MTDSISLKFHQNNIHPRHQIKAKYLNNEMTLAAEKNKPFPHSDLCGQIFFGAVCSVFTHLHPPCTNPSAPHPSLHLSIPPSPLCLAGVQWCSAVICYLHPPRSPLTVQLCLYTHCLQTSSLRSDG